MRELLEGISFIETVQQVDPRSQGRGDGGFVFKGDRGSLLQDEKAPEMDGGGGQTTGSVFLVLSCYLVNKPKKRVCVSLMVQMKQLGSG